MVKTKDYRVLIITKFLSETSKPHHQIARELGFVQSTVSRVIARFKATQTTGRKRAGGRKAGIVNQTLAQKVVLFVQKQELELPQKYQVRSGWIHS